jgi:hypothetical protein
MNIIIQIKVHFQCYKLYWETIHSHVTVLSKCMGVNIKEMFYCTYENLFLLKKKWCKMHKIQTISKYGTTCHSK